MKPTLMTLPILERYLVIDVSDFMYDVSDFMYDVSDFMYELEQHYELSATDRTLLEVALRHAQVALVVSPSSSDGGAGPSAQSA